MEKRIYILNQVGEFPYIDPTREGWEKKCAFKIETLLGLGFRDEAKDKLRRYLDILPEEAYSSSEETLKYQLGRARMRLT